MSDKLQVLSVVGIVAFGTALFLSGCGQHATRYGGGTSTISLPCGMKYVHSSWKENNIWYAYRPARPGEPFETINMSESSQFGLAQGTVVFVEKACSR